MAPDGGPLPERLLARFEGHSWPGNIRELRNAVARAIALGDLAEDPRRPSVPPPSSQALPLPSADDVVDSVLAQDLPLALARQKIVDDFEKRYVERILGKYGGNVTRAAAASGIARRYFYTLKNRLGV